MRSGLGAILGLGCLMAGATPAAAEPAVGVLTGSNVLASFDTATPGTFTSLRPITGLGPGEQIQGVDFRYFPQTLTPPQSPRLFALSVEQVAANDELRTYTIDTATAAATRVGAASVAIPGADSYGFDFNPSADRIRVVNDLDDNLRINPNSGGRADFPGNDANLTPGPVLTTAVAHDRVHLPPTFMPVNTTAYGIDRAGGTLLRIGSLNQTPNSANTGMTEVAGALGITLTGDAREVNFDISRDGTAYLAANEVSAGPSLFTVNLGTGAATLIGSLATPLEGFAIVPASASQPPPPGPTVDRTAPVLSRLGVRPKTFRFGKGTTFGFTLSEAATVRFTLERRTRGRRVGGKCRKQTRGNRRRRACTRYVKVGSFSARFGAGANTRKFSGKVGRRRLGPGRYRVALTAKDGAGNASPAKRASFRVLPRKKRR
jgi:hypothetical protein